MRRIAPAPKPRRSSRSPAETHRARRRSSPSRRSRSTWRFAARPSISPGISADDAHDAMTAPGCGARESGSDQPRSARQENVHAIRSGEHVPADRPVRVHALERQSRTFLHHEQRESSFPADEHRGQRAQMRFVSDDRERMRRRFDPPQRGARIVFRLEVRHQRERSRQPQLPREQLRGLARTRQRTMPELRGLKEARTASEIPPARATCSRPRLTERPLGILVGADSVRVPNQIQHSWRSLSLDRALHASSSVRAARISSFSA